MQQLVEVALHALSPGMNEPFTAVTCIDRLGEGLALLARRQLPSAARRDDQGRLRVVAPPQTFVTLLRDAVAPIAIFAGPNPAISERLLRTLAMLAGAAQRSEDLAVVGEQAGIVWREADRQIEDPLLRSQVERQYRRALAAADRAGGDARPLAGEPRPAAGHE